MPETDVMSSLLPMLMGQGGSAEGPDPNTVGSLMALKSSPFLQGVPSQSGPMGQISQAIMPLIEAKIYGQQAQKSQQEEQLKHMVDILTLGVKVQELRRQGALSDAQISKFAAEAGFDKAQTRAVTTMLDVFEKTGKIPPGASLNIGGVRLSAPQETPAEKESRINRQAAYRIALEQRANDEAVGKLLGRQALSPESSAPAPGTSTTVVGEEPTRMNPSYHVSGGKIGVTLTPDKPPKPTSQDIGSSVSMQTVAGLRPMIQKELDNLPPEIPNIVMEAKRYVMPQQAVDQPGVMGAIESRVIGSPDPKLVPYFTAIGQLEAAVSRAGATIAGRGGKYLVDILQKHVPHLGDQPRVARDKIDKLYSPQGIFVQQVLPELRRLTQTRVMSPSEAGKLMWDLSLIKRTMVNPDTKRVLGLGVDGKIYDMGDSNSYKENQ